MSSRPHVHVDTSINVNVWTCIHINVTTCVNVCKHEYNNTRVPRMLVVSQEQTVSASNLHHYTCRHNSRVSTSLRTYMLWSHVNSNSHNASPHTSPYSCLDKLRVLPFMSAEHDMRVKTLLPKGANRTNSKPSSQDRCQSH